MHYKEPSREEDILMNPCYKLGTRQSQDRSCGSGKGFMLPFLFEDDEPA